MTKRLILYPGVIVVAIALFVIASDRHVTEKVPVLEHGIVRFLAVLAVLLVLGRAARPLFRAKPDARAGS